ncbi:hypothetical protein GEMRC1_000625 [Eukaryota sp. GEM-RC1]
MLIFEAVYNGKLSSSVDVSPHCIDTAKGVFSFSSHGSSGICFEKVSSLSWFLNSFKIKELTLRGCHFTSEALTVLCDSLRVNNSLTFIDCSFFSMLNKSFKALADALAVNTSVTMIAFADTNMSVSTQKYIERKLRGRITFEDKNY